MWVKWFQDGREDITCDKRSNCITASRPDLYVERNEWDSEVWELIDCSDDDIQIELNRHCKIDFNQRSEHEESVCQMGTDSSHHQLNSMEKRIFAFTFKQECWKNLIMEKRKRLLWGMSVRVWPQNMTHKSPREKSRTYETNKTHMVQNCSLWISLSETNILPAFNFQTELWIMTVCLLTPDFGWSDFWPVGRFCVGTFTALSCEFFIFMTLKISLKWSHFESFGCIQYIMADMLEYMFRVRWQVLWRRSHSVKISDNTFLFWVQLSSCQSS
jgi:hypothetical protein